MIDSAVDDDRYHKSTPSALLSETTMPLIEELPTTSTVRASHGWAYVPDTGPIAAIQPGTRDRKRAAATSGRGRAQGAAFINAKQQKAIQNRLLSLDKENYKDGVAIPIPQRAGREKTTGKKMTTNVRRILTYQRTFAHYLADEEANAGSGTTTNAAMPPPPTPVAAPPNSSQKPESSRRRSGATTVVGSINEPTPTPTPTPTRGRGRPSLRHKSSASAGTSEEPTKVKKEDSNTTTNDVPTETPAVSTPAVPVTVQPPYDSAWDQNPLLKTHDIPKMPSERVMQALLAEPPLSYAAARAHLSPDDDMARPTRHFCALCGYWGKVKCKKCGEWTCGIIECWRGHEGVCSMAGTY